ncbi:substrate-binding periplasmic protein [Dethiosulfovibrio salsuginis]|uniref:Amino acid ABC transporter substrate-binding protein, PAAT family n=1 Tax=Dethiosulfovibrio salsuginis TaxID=561720 RepID=A0A1X7J7W8_9BACT|nr:transporter substrate-binding domain-containing protein [Dethiosulfovibrio salsuginis]SMG23783.1 amino acid ABC transporter substrate-binding protein, PAAT family [Dethiosulfovibrio salsuginis]
MRKSFRLSTLALLVVLIWSGILSADAKAIRYGGAVGWSPLMVKGDNGRIVGVAVDVMNELGNRLHRPVELSEELPWKRLMDYAEKGEIDVVAGIYKTEEREKVFLFSQPFMVNTAKLFVLKDNIFTVNDLQDLKGKSGGKPSGGSFGEKFDSFAAANLKMNEAVNKETLYKMLQGKRFDFVVMDGDDGMAYLAKNGLQDDIKMLDFDVNTVKVYLAISKKSPVADMVGDIDKALLDMESDGTLQRIADSYRN